MYWNMFLKTQEMSKRAAKKCPRSLEYIPYKCKTREMCEIAVEDNPYVLDCGPDQ